MAKWPYSWPWPKVRLEVLERDRYICQIVGPKCAGKAVEVDHIIPPSEAPHLRIDLSNLRSACRPCNRARGQQRLAAMAHLNRQRVPEPSRDWFGTGGADR